MKDYPALMKPVVLSLLTAALGETNKEKRDEMIQRAIEGIELM